MDLFKDMTIAKAFYYAAILIAVLYYSSVLKAKARMRNIDKLYKATLLKFKNEGKDKYYENFSNDELLLQYEQFQNERAKAIQLKSKDKGTIEIECNMEIIKEILDKRNIEIPQEIKI